VAGASGRVDADDYTKEDVRDFALWKSVGEDEIGWDTRLGRGRPGWHIECSAMSMSLLGESFDVHCGGVDNIFPHHENEIAQSEAATGRRLASIWCHGAHLQISGEKMAKRLGNFRFVPDLVAAGARPAVIRYFLIAGAHYRRQLSWDEEAFFASSAAVDRMVDFRDRLASASPSQATSGRAVALVDEAWSVFQTAMDHDLNTPEAIAAVFTAIRDINRELDGPGLSGDELSLVRRWISDVDDVLGVLPLVDAQAAGEIDADTQALLDARVRAREGGNWAESDRIREQLAGCGVLVEDTPQGQRWKRR